MERLVSEDILDTMDEEQRMALLRNFMKHSKDPIRQAFDKFLEGLKAEFNQHPPMVKPLICFISYAWEKEMVDLKAQQTWLLQLRDDLTTLGMEVFLDLTNMHGVLDTRMREEIEKSDYIFLIGTSRLKQRVEQVAPTNVQFEWSCIQAECKKQVRKMH